MSVQRVALTLAVGVAGLAVGIAGVAADVAWLGLVAGMLALVTAVLAYFTSARLHVRDTESERLQKEIDELKHTAASQIQARMSAETDAAQAEQRAKKAELGKDMLAGRMTSDGPEAELTDPVTGLYGEDFFKASVNSRVHSARRHLRPVSVVLLTPTMGVAEGETTEADPIAVTAALIETVREADTVCRLVDGGFGLILEDTPENGAIWTVERFRRRIATEIDSITIWAGIACYPAHAFDADVVVDLAQRALRSAREWGQDRIEVAEAP